MARSKTIAQAAVEIGCSASFLYEHRRGSIIDMGDGQVIHLVAQGRFHRVPDIEIARYLREVPPLPEQGQVAS
jgi:hypothetical protein